MIMYQRLTLQELVNLTKDGTANPDYERIAKELAFRITNQNSPMRNVYDRVFNLLTDVENRDYTHSKLETELGQITDILYQFTPY